MQTKIRDDAYNVDLHVGFEFDPDEVLEPNLLDSGYEPTGHPSRDGKLRLIEDWLCPTCAHVNLAQVTIDGTRIAEIVPLPVVRASTADAQFVHGRTAELLSDRE